MLPYESAWVGSNDWSNFLVNYVKSMVIFFLPILVMFTVSMCFKQPMHKLTTKSFGRCYSWIFLYAFPSPDWFFMFSSLGAFSLSWVIEEIWCDMHFVTKLVNSAFQSTYTTRLYEAPTDILGTVFVFLGCFIIISTTTLPCGLQVGSVGFQSECVILWISAYFFCKGHSFTGPYSLIFVIYVICK